MFWTAPSKAMLAWDMGQGPTYDADAKRKTLGECEVWRSVDPLSTACPAVCIGTTTAEAFLDTDVVDGGCYYYWVMSRLQGGGLHQIGPMLDVEMPSAWPDDWDRVSPSEVDDLAATGVPIGIELTWKAASDDDSGVLAYFIYDSNQDQPDSVVWANELVKEGSGRIASFIDLLPNGITKSYYVRALDRALNLSEGVGPVTATAGGVFNLCVNPRMHISADGWNAPGSLVISRATSARFSLPAGADACMRVQSPSYYGTANVWSDPVPLPEGWTHLYASCYSCVTVDEKHGNHWSGGTPILKFYNAAGAQLSSSATALSSGYARYSDTTWARCLSRDLWGVPEGAVACSVGIQFLALDGVGSLYFTKVMLSDVDRVSDILYVGTGAEGTVTTATPHGYDFPAYVDRVVVHDVTGYVSVPPNAVNDEHRATVFSATQFAIPVEVTTEATENTGITFRMRDYADGDTAGWQWDGAAHNSISRQAS